MERQRIPVSGHRGDTASIAELTFGRSGRSERGGQLCTGPVRPRIRGLSGAVSTRARIAALVIMLTIGTRPREFDLAEAEPFTAPFTLEWLEQALQRRSKSDFSNRTVLFEADNAAIFSSAFDRMSRAISTLSGNMVFWIGACVVGHFSAEQAIKRPQKSVSKPPAQIRPFSTVRAARNNKHRHRPLVASISKQLKAVRVADLPTCPTLAATEHGDGIPGPLSPCVSLPRKLPSESGGPRQME